MPPGAYLIARMAMAMLFVSIISLLLIAAGDVRSAHVPMTFGAGRRRSSCIDVLGVLPFCAIGMFVGSLVSGQAAPAIVNLIFLPMAFLSGLWLPLQFLPKFLQQIAPIWPAYHLAQLALPRVGAPSDGHASRAMSPSLAGITHACSSSSPCAACQSGGFRLLGARPRRALHGGSPAAAAIVAALSFSGVFGGKPASMEDATAATDAASAAAGTPASEAPAGSRAAPADRR